MVLHDRHSVSSSSWTRLWNGYRVRCLGTLAVALTAACGQEGLPPEAGQETRVLVVARRDDRVSQDVSDAYVKARGIARSHRLDLDCTSSEEISRETFEDQVQRPLARWWQATPAEKRPQYIVLMPNLPLKIRGRGGLDGDRASVDSELCLLPRVASGTTLAPNGKERNPYFRSRRESAAKAASPYAAFSFARYGICLVTRIAGSEREDAFALIARGVAGDSLAKAGVGIEGQFLFDMRGTSRSEGNQWLAEAARLTGTYGADVALEATSVFIHEATDLAGYASWGSNDPEYRRKTGFTWLPGALATNFVSTSARTLTKPPANWSPGPSADPERSFGGSTQSLSTDLVHSGATGVSGNVYEPYLDGCVRPEILFPAYLQGRTLAESFYLATPYLSWQGIVLGDPLAARYSHRDTETALKTQVGAGSRS